MGIFGILLIVNVLVVDAARTRRIRSKNSSEQQDQTDTPNYEEYYDENYSDYDETGNGKFRN